MNKQHNWIGEIFSLVLWLIVSFTASVPGILYVPGQWYEELIQPAWTPPGYVFGLVWPVLYCMMGVAAWLIWRRKDREVVRWAIIWFVAQLIANALWTVIFFGFHSPLAAYVDIVVLWALIFLTVREFWRINRWAGALLVPYWVWVTFAGTLNWQIWWLNG